MPETRSEGRGIPRKKAGNRPTETPPWRAAREGAPPQGAARMTGVAPPRTQGHHLTPGLGAEGG